MPLVLALNVGSSSVKFAVYRFGGEQRVLSGVLERIGAGGHFRADGIDVAVALPNLDAAVTHLLEWLPGALAGERVAAVGHRVVHGGSRFGRPVVVTPEVVAALRELVPFAPLHQPAGLAAIEAAQRAFADVPHVACFDTAFHRTMPAIAARYALPRELHDAGVRRYGFHGLSFEFIAGELARMHGPSAGGRVVVAHLGGGASLCALVNGESVDTTMGLTPLGGLVMGTRCGDIDPEVPLYLVEERGLSPSAARDLLARESGLLGVSGTSADVRDLLAAEGSDPRAADALKVFCYAIRKGVAAMAAAAGGIDELVFTGGIGARSAPLRDRVAAGLAFLGVRLDPARNANGAAVLSPSGGAVTVRVCETNEEIVIARQAAAEAESRVTSAG